MEFLSVAGAGKLLSLIYLYWPGYKIVGFFSRENARGPNPINKLIFKNILILAILKFNAEEERNRIATTTGV